MSHCFCFSSMNDQTEKTEKILQYTMFWNFMLFQNAAIINIVIVIMYIYQPKSKMMNCTHVWGTKKTFQCQLISSIRAFFIVHPVIYIIITKIIIMIIIMIHPRASVSCIQQIQFWHFCCFLIARIARVQNQSLILYQFRSIFFSFASFILFVRLLPIKQICSKLQRWVNKFPKEEKKKWLALYANKQ